MFTIEYPDDMNLAERFLEIARILAKGFSCKIEESVFLRSAKTGSARITDHSVPVRDTERLENAGNSVTGLDLSNHL